MFLLQVKRQIEIKKGVW